MLIVWTLTLTVHPVNLFRLSFITCIPLGWKSGYEAYRLIIEALGNNSAKGHKFPENYYSAGSAIPALLSTFDFELRKTTFQK